MTPAYMPTSHDDLGNKMLVFIPHVILVIIVVAFSRRAAIHCTPSYPDNFEDKIVGRMSDAVKIFFLLHVISKSTISWCKFL